MASVDLAAHNAAWQARIREASSVVIWDNNQANNKSAQERASRWQIGRPKHARTLHTMLTRWRMSMRSMSRLPHAAHEPARRVAAVAGQAQGRGAAATGPSMATCALGSSGAQAECGGLWKFLKTCRERAGFNARVSCSFPSTSENGGFRGTPTETSQPVIHSGATARPHQGLPHNWPHALESSLGSESHWHSNRSWSTMRTTSGVLRQGQRLHGLDPLHPGGGG